MNPTDITTLIQQLPQAVSDFETEVTTMKYYMLFTAAALAWLVLRDARR